MESKFLVSDRYLGITKSVVYMSLPMSVGRHILGYTSLYAVIVFILAGLAGISYMYLSAKWVNVLERNPTGILWYKCTDKDTIERCMEVCLFSSVSLLVLGILLAVMN